MKTTMEQAGMRLGGVSLPQPLATTDSPTFAGLTLDALLNADSGNEIVLQLDYTVNKLAGNDTAIRVNMIDEASPGESLFLDLSLGGSNKFSVNNAGAVKIGGMEFSNPETSAMKLKSLEASNTSLLFHSNADAFLGKLQFLGDGSFAIDPASNKIKKPLAGSLKFITNAGTWIFEATAATDVPLTVNGAVSQTADLQQWTDSSDSILASIDNIGDMTINGIDFAGASYVGGDPTTTGYFVVKVGGTQYKIPVQAV